MIPSSYYSKAMFRACLLLLALMSTAFKHDFHTSLTEINFNPKTKSLELSLRVFTDDLESTLTSFNNGKRIRIEEPESVVNPLIEQYIRKNLALISPTKEVDRKSTRLNSSHVLRSRMPSSA